MDQNKLLPKRAIWPGKNHGTFIAIFRYTGHTKEVVINHNIIQRKFSHIPGIAAMSPYRRCGEPPVYFVTFKVRILIRVNGFPFQGGTGLNSSADAYVHWGIWRFGHSGK